MWKILFAVLFFASSLFADGFEFRCSHKGLIAKYLTNQHEYVDESSRKYIVVDFNQAKTRKHVEHGGTVVDAWFVFLNAKREESGAGYVMILLSFDMREKAAKTLSKISYSCNGDIFYSWHDDYPSDYLGWKPIPPDSVGMAMYNKIKEALAR